MCIFYSPLMRGRFLRIVFSAIVVSFVWNPVYAQDSNNVMTLEAAIAKALNRNPELQLYATRLLGLRGLQESAHLSPAMEIAVEVENFAGSGDFSAMDQAETTVALSSYLELGNKKNARIAFASARYSQVQINQQIEALALLAEVTRRYIVILATQQSVLLAEEAAEIAEDALISIKQRAQAGASMRSEELRAQAEKIQAFRKKENLKTELIIAKSQLALMWGKTEIDFHHLSGDLFAVGEIINIDDFQSAIRQNPIVAAYASELSVRQAQLEVIQSQGSPDIQWQIGARQFQETSDSALVLGINIPLFAGRRSHGNITSAETDVLDVKKRRAIALLQLQNTLFSLTKQQQQTIAQVNELKQTIIPLLKEAATEAKSAYERGRYRYVDWINAQRELISAQENLISSAKEALSLRASIEQHTAASLSRVINNNSNNKKNSNNNSSDNSND